MSNINFSVKPMREGSSAAYAKKEHERMLPQEWLRDFRLKKPKLNNTFDQVGPLRNTSVKL